MQRGDGGEAIESDEDVHHFEHGGRDVGEAGEMKLPLPQTIGLAELVILPLIIYFFAR